MTMMNNVRLNQDDAAKWLHNMLVFLAPVLILYFTTVAGVIAEEGHAFSVQDFIPTPVAQGAIVLWFLNAMLDYLRKLKAER